jgi:serine/threonine-protein kinase
VSTPARAVEAERIGPYVIDGVVESRGLFATLLATHELGHRAYLRTTASHVVARPELREVLVAEAKLSASLPSEAFSSLLELVDDGARTAVAYQAPDGPSLREVLDATRRRGGASPTEALALLFATTRSLALLHERGVVHGAVCPERCYVSARGALVRLRDPRWASLAPSRRASSSELDVDPIEEPPPAAGAYRAPEQILGAAPTAASDVFALGLVGYELLAGRHPFEDASSAEVARKIRHAEPPPIVIREPKARFVRSTVEDLELTLGALLAKGEALRPPTATQVLRDLEPLVRDLPIDAVLAGLLERLELGDPRRGVRASRSRSPSVAAELAPKLVAVAIAMTLGAALFGTVGAPKPQAVPKAGDEPGAIRVLARPWAEVHLDGARVDVTPIGRPIPVPPGRHELVFRHPVAPEERREVHVATGQTVTVEVRMSIVRGVDAGVETSP